MLKYFFSFSCLLVACGYGREAPARPNILFILADDLGWRTPSCYGSREVATVNIDRIAAEGMRFTQAYADAQCSPSRAAFLSGQYGARTGVFDVISDGRGRPIPQPATMPMRPPPVNRLLAPEVGSLACSLRAAGYTTGLSGKWHVSGSYSVAQMRTADGGKFFDRYGFDFAGRADEEAHQEDKAVDAITDDILGFIEQNRVRPWFAYVSHFSPHSRFHAPPALVEKYAARGYRRTSNPSGRFSERPSAEYLAMIEHLDASVGRLLDGLERMGLTERTLVIFISDNGGLARAASLLPLREAKGSPYEGGIRVPFVARWPGVIAPGFTCAVPIHLVDFYPTFLELARAAAPSGHRLDGESLVPLLRGRGALRRTALFWHLPTYAVPYGRTPCAVVRDGDWKLIHWFGDYLDTTGVTPDDVPYGRLIVGPREELYQLSEDGGETRNLLETHPAKAAELRGQLERWWRDTGAAFPAKNPDYDPADWWIYPPLRARR